MNRSRILEIVNDLLTRQREIMTHEIAAKMGASRQAAHKHLRALVRAGLLIREGAGRGTRYRRAQPEGSTLRYKRRGLEEETVWKDLLRQAPELKAATESVLHVLQYAVTEIVNNAIDHSGSEVVEMFVPARTAPIAFEVVDDGVGIFEHLRRGLKLESLLAALQELSKGKVTTDPGRHTGEGIFFVSKAADILEIEANGLRWVVDNLRQDTAVGACAPRKGTRVRFEIDPKKRVSLKAVFDEYARDFEFSKTRIVVKLFALGTRFISRSEARRLTTGLEKFREIVMDFSGVEAVGQGFADEVFRIWAKSHPGIELIPRAMNPAVEFMVERARRSA